MQVRVIARTQHVTTVHLLLGLLPVVRQGRWDDPTADLRWKDLRIGAT